MAKKKCAITDYSFETPDIEKAILEPLGCQIVAQKSAKDPEALAALVKDADFVITQFAPVNASVIGAMQKCKVIVRYGIGVDNVDLAAAAAKNIPVCNIPDYCVDEVADHALAMILDVVRAVTAHTVLIRSGRWALAVPLETVHALKDLTVGVVAFGRIGREVAARLGAFKCKVIVFDPAVDAATIKAAGCEPVGLDDLLRRSDLITLHCPSNEKTKHMIDAASIATMKPGVLLVNTSRGTLAKTDDLVAALQSGKIAAAGLDVFDPEPLPVDHPLRKMENVLLSPHMASCSPQAVLKLRTDAANIVAAAFRGQKLPNIVNGVKA